MTSFPHPRRAIRLRPAALAFAPTLHLLRLWLWRARTRHELSLLTPEQMRDTGLDPVRIRHESAKPFWRE